jgi:hypothetical protein
MHLEKLLERAAYAVVVFDQQNERSPGGCHAALIGPSRPGL